MYIKYIKNGWSNILQWFKTFKKAYIFIINCYRYVYLYVLNSELSENQLQCKIFVGVYNLL